MRRTLAFSARIHNYLLLLYLFSFGLFFTQLWWDITGEYGFLVSGLNTLLAVTGILHAMMLLVMSLVIWLVDRVFPTWEFWSTILRTALIVACQFTVSLFASVTSGGVHMNL